MAKKTAPLNTPKAAYAVLSPLHYDGDRYEIGETVELEEPVAAPLLAAGVIAPVAAGEG